MHGWMWAALAAELLALLFGFDWARRDHKYGRRMADYRTRVSLRPLAPPVEPEVWQAGVLAAMIHARNRGDLVVSDALQERMWAAENERLGGWSRKVVPIR